MPRILRLLLSVFLLFRFSHSLSDLTKESILNNRLPELQYETVEQSPIPTVATTTRPTVTRKVTVAKSTTRSTTSTTTVAPITTTKATVIPPTVPSEFLEIRESSGMLPESQNADRETIAHPVSLTIDRPESQSADRETIAHSAFLTTNGKSAAKSNSMREWLSGIVRKDFVEKRAVLPSKYKNGVLESKFILPMATSSAPDSALRGLSKERLQKGDHDTVDYVGVYIFTDPVTGRRSSVWGRISPDEGNGREVAGTFIVHGKVTNTTDPEVKKKTYFVKNDQTEDDLFRYAWVANSALDRTTAVTVLSDECTVTAAAVWMDQEHNFEWLGEADLAKKQFSYVKDGHLWTITERAKFQTEVFVLTKQRCQCQCENSIIYG